MQISNIIQIHRIFSSGTELTHHSFRFSSVRFGFVPFRFVSFYIEIFDEYWCILSSRDCCSAFFFFTLFDFFMIRKLEFIFIEEFYSLCSFLLLSISLSRFFFLFHSVFHSFWWFWWNYYIFTLNNWWYDKWKTL